MTRENFLEEIVKTEAGRDLLHTLAENILDIQFAIRSTAMNSSPQVCASLLELSDKLHDLSMKSRMWLLID